VIDSRDLRRIAAENGVASVDAEGRVVETPIDGATLPSLLVAPVSEAVKHVRGDRLMDDLDRSQLWAVRGIAVDHVVATSLPDGSFTLAELIELVDAAGHVWGTTLL
jgi:hypothetical protein